jgi:hypothetical protein
MGRIDLATCAGAVAKSVGATLVVGRFIYTGLLGILFPVAHEGAGSVGFTSEYERAGGANSVTGRITANAVYTKTRQALCAATTGPLSEFFALFRIFT